MTRYEQAIAWLEMGEKTGAVTSPCADYLRHLKTSHDAMIKLLEICDDGEVQAGQSALVDQIRLVISEAEKLK